MPLDRQELLESLRSVTAENAPFNVSKKRYSAAAHKAEVDGFSSMFACGGKIDATQYNLPSSIYLQGLGQLALPLSPSDISRLVGLSEQAPSGKGTATIVEKSVREARQIDAALLTYHPQNSTFFLYTAQAIAAHAVEKLGMDPHNIRLDAKPYKLLLYEAGGHFAFHQNTEREFGMFGTLIIQIPTLSPHQGGQVVVHRTHDSVTFDFCGSKRSEKFYFTTFFADCQHMLKLITTGSWVCLVFNLVCQSTQVIPLHHSPGTLLTSVARTEAALKSWLQSPDEKGPQNIFIPLEHKYTKTNLCFAGLKGNDAVAAEMLRRCRRNMSPELSFELLVCIITRHRFCEGEDGDYDRSEFDVTKWVGENDREVNFSSIKIDLDSELLIYQGDLFHDDLEPDAEDHDDEFKRKYGSSDQYWYHIAMLAVWPKRKTMPILGHGGLEGGLDLVEVKMSKGEMSDAEVLFKDLLNFLHRNPQELFHTIRKGKMAREEKYSNKDHRMSRILHLCAQIGDDNDMVKVIDVLGGSKEGGKHWQRYESKRFGIGNAEVAKMLSLAVQTHGWDVCGPLIEEKVLLGSRIRDQCECYANLALQFESINMHDTALSITKKVGTLILNMHGILSELTESDVVAIFVLLFALPGCHDELAPSLVDRMLKEATDVTLCRVVTKLKEAGSKGSLSDRQSKKHFCLKDNRVLLDLFTKICKGLAIREFKLPENPNRSYYIYFEEKFAESIMKYIVEIMEVFLWLEDSSLLEDLVKSIVSQSQKCKDQLLLKKILASSALWQKASTTDLGRNALKNLLEERMHKLERECKPVFTWCQTSATLPGYADVEAFLRGPFEQSTFFNFTGLPQARDFASKYFGGWMSGRSHDGYGYSATAQEGGKGRASYCKIVKTRCVFEEMERQWHAERRELAGLQSRLQELLGTMTEEENGRQALIMDAMPDGERPSDANKRLKADVESVGSRKECPIVL
ncbi:hypothetical protein L7F22_051213 [Adiantum nelumboides]|nr:hypothetical protein [Adiantum nelumboides]